MTDRSPPKRRLLIAALLLAGGADLFYPARLHEASGSPNWLAVQPAPLEQRMCLNGCLVGDDPITFAVPFVGIVLPADVIGEENGEFFVIHRANASAPETRRAVVLGKATVDGVEVFGMDAGFVRRAVSMGE